MSPPSTPDPSAHALATTASLRRPMWLIAGRLAVATLVLGSVLVVTGGQALESLTSRTVLLLIAATFGSALAAAATLRRLSSRWPWAAAQLAWDLLLVTVLTYALGGALSGFSFLYGVIIVAASLVLDVRAALLSTVAAVALYLLVSVGLAEHWIAPIEPGALLAVPRSELVSVLVRNTVGFALIGMLAGGLAERLRRTGGELQAVAEHAQELAQLNEHILTSLGSGLAIVDLDATLVQINPAGAALLGGEPATFASVPVREHLPVDIETDEGRDVERGDGEGVRLDGTRFPVGFSCSELRDAAGALLGTLVLFQDLTELRELRDKAQRAERLAALGRLSAGLAHEIRNPLGSIRGSVELVSEAPALDPEDGRLLSLVISEVDRLDDLVTTMLDVGRPSAPVPVSVDLRVLTADVIAVMEASAGVAVELTEPTTPVRAHADPSQLRQVLWNLLKNASQFSPAGESVTVELTTDASHAELRVSDRGPGIAEEDQSHLFDMFFSKRQHGIGLGLTLVHQIVHAHGGEITVESVLGEGATFVVRLPLARSLVPASMR